MKLLISLLATALGLSAQDANQLQQYRWSQFKLNQHVLAVDTAQGSTTLQLGSDASAIQSGDHVLLCNQERVVATVTSNAVTITAALATACPSGSPVPVLLYPDEQSIYDAAIDAKRQEIQDRFPSAAVQALQADISAKQAAIESAKKADRAAARAKEAKSK